MRAIHISVVYARGSCVSVIIMLASATAVFGQVVRFEVPVIVSDGVESDTLYFGILPVANFCIVGSDSINGHVEYFLPPVPPKGVFDARLVWPRSGTNFPCFDQGAPYDYRPYTSSTQRDTFRVRSQVGTGTTMVLSWPAGLSSRFTGLTLRYFDGTQNVNIDMLTNTFANITDADPKVANIYSAGLVIPPSPPPAPTLVSPPDGALNVSLTPVLTWNTAPTATTYHLQVAGDSLFTQIVVDDSTLTGTSQQVGPLSAATLYYWHVRAKNVGGVSSYSSTFRFTTLDVPPVPSPISPPDGAVNVSQQPVLTWSSIATASTYHLQVARDSLYTQMVFDDSTLTGTSRQVGPLSASTLYYWHVRAKNMAGVSPFSPNFRFTTTAAPPAPALISPPDSATVVPLPTRFVWSRVPAATWYHLQVGTTPTFTTMVFEDSMITDSTRTVASLAWSATLYWRVRARNTSGASEFTPPWRFTVMMPVPSAPALVYPNNGQANVPPVTEFRWRHVVLGAGYHLQIAHDDLFTTMFYEDTTLTDSLTSVRLAPSLSYYWRVRARNIEHTWGVFSFSRVFSTLNGPPAVPVPLYPLNGDTGVVRNVTFRWVGSPGTITYRVQVAFDIGFIQIFADDSTITGTQYFAGILPAGISAHWRVRAKGQFVQPSAWSPVQSFRTEVTTAVENGEDGRVPSGFVLHQNYPNPFNPSTNIRYEVYPSSFTSIKVFDMLGREVATLVNGEVNPGVYETTFDAGNLPSGVYLMRMNAVAEHNKQVFTAVRKIILMK